MQWCREKYKFICTISSRSKQVTFCSLCCFSLFNEWITPVNLASVSLLMLCSVPFNESSRLGWISFNVFLKSIDITSVSSLIVLIWLFTFCWRHIWLKRKMKQCWEHRRWNIWTINATWLYYEFGKTFSFWSSCRWDLSSPNFFDVRSLWSTSESVTFLYCPQPAISSRIWEIWEFIFKNSLILSSFFDLKSSKTGLIVVICCFRVPFPYRMQRINWIGTS